MKYWVFGIAIIALAGCQKKSSTEVVTKHFPNIPQPVPAAQPEPFQLQASALAGEWQNASCGERQYLRRITFVADGTFTAIDEVAPCPEDAQCVSSGIIEWRGTWRTDGKTIPIEATPAEEGRLPELLPEAFVVVAEAPLSVGEQIGSTVCPYRRHE